MRLRSGGRLNSMGVHGFYNRIYRFKGRLKITWAVTLGDQKRGALSFVVCIPNIDICSSLVQQINDLRSILIGCTMHRGFAVVVDLVDIEA